MSEPQPKPQSEDDKTDIYIALLEAGLMGREDFLKLMISEKKQDNLVDCMWNKKKAEEFKTKQEIPCF